MNMPAMNYGYFTLRTKIEIQKIHFISSYEDLVKDTNIYHARNSSYSTAHKKQQKKRIVIFLIPEKMIQVSTRFQCLSMNKKVLRIHRHIPQHDSTLML